MSNCACCKVGEPLQPLAGTGHAFCPNCASMVARMADEMERRGQTIEAILKFITRRYSSA